ncbi:hypothetical protein EV361DRAFT_797926 [Lentinula raphanica]|uniref:RING-CH-type domain-containing protein n=1 Tax=Lentinula raphanica TaxID=153919 RepID=A0AA38UGE8_9AGAR|nr:hypothetical protein F5878DRAFT_539760 [Lentinula raphanica]KAJ3972545.1 hypothetical protein EV361DRAFT_797926 [Lentinula raphanica]
MSDYVPTIDDIRVKMCYICREEENADEPSDPPRTWTHPCKCTLIAHEACLLSWIETAQAKPTGRDAMKCPQCGTQYEIVHNRGQFGFGQRIAWRMLTDVNIIVGYLGKMVLILVPSTILSVVGAGAYWMLTRYGAYAIREFFGQEIYDTFLTDDMTKWPWSAYINLPLIPIFLVASRFDTKFGFLPIISALLEWPNLYDREPQIPMPMPPNLTNIFPPSPYTVGFILLPIARFLYDRALKRLTKWVLGARVPTVDGEDENALMVVRVRGGANDGEPQNANQENQQDDNQPADQPGVEEPVAEHNPAEQTITIYASPLGRKLAGALLVPMIARHMGNTLLRLARKQGVLARYLRSILAISPRSAPNRSWWDANSLSSTSSSSWKAGSGSASPSLSFGVGNYRWGVDNNGSTFFGSNVPWKDVWRALWGGSKAWAEFDPVWWRNTIGFGLFVVAKDALNLLHLWLIKRERETRRIKNRDFAGVDITGLDLIERTTS